MRLARLTLNRLGFSAGVGAGAPAPADVLRAGFRAAAPYAAAGSVCLLTLVVVMELWKADFRAPFQNDIDGLYSQLFVKNALETGSYTTNDRGGAPYGLILYDFPTSEGVHFALIRVIGAFSRNVFRVINVFSYTR
jgi:hypothetical protein